MIFGVGMIVRFQIDIKIYEKFKTYLIMTKKATFWGRSQFTSLFREVRVGGYPEIV